MSEQLVDANTLNELIEGVKTPKTKIKTANKSEDLVKSFLKEILPGESIVDVSGDKLECDIYIPTSHLRVEVKVKTNDPLYSFEDKLLKTMSIYPDDLFLYFNLADRKKTMVLERLICINGTKITKDEFKTIVLTQIESHKYYLKHKKEYMQIITTRFGKTEEPINEETLSETNHISIDISEELKEYSENEVVDEPSLEIESNEEETDDHAKWTQEAEELIKTVFAEERKEKGIPMMVRIFDSVFKASYEELKTNCVVQSDYVQRIISAIEEYNKIVSKDQQLSTSINKTQYVVPYLTKLGCGKDKRWKLPNPEDPEKITSQHVFSYITESEAKKRPKKTTNYFGNLLTYIDTHDIPTEFVHEFKFCNADRKCTGTELVHYPEIFMEVYAKFYQLNGRVPSGLSDGCEVQINDETIKVHLRELLTYIQGKNIKLARLIFSKILHAYLPTDYDAEVDRFIKLLKDAIAKKINFAEIELKKNKSDKPTSLHQMFLNLKTSSGKERMNPSLLEAYRRRKNDIERIMKTNRDIIMQPNPKIEQLGLHKHCTGRVKANGKPETLKCYDFNDGFMV